MSCDVQYDDGMTLGPKKSSSPDQSYSWMPRPLEPKMRGNNREVNHGASVAGCYRGVTCTLPSDCQAGMVKVLLAGSGKYSIGILLQVVALGDVLIIVPIFFSFE